MRAYLKPVYSAAVNEGRKLPQTVAEGIAYWAHTQHNVQLISHSVNEHVVQCHDGTISLLRFLSCPGQKQVGSIQTV